MATRPEPTPEEAARIDAARSALNAHKLKTGISWAALGEAVGRAGGTLSVFATNKYEGVEITVAEQVERYFASLATQAALGAPKVPGFVMTPTASEMIALLQWAQSGAIVAVACAPGLGKTKTAQHYRGLAPNVWLATMTKSSARLQPMQIKVLKAMGIDAPKVSPLHLSALICAKLANSGGLLILDEFHELTDDAVEEIRSWYDETGVGMAFAGDYRVIATIEKGKSSRDRAQIFRRVSKRMVKLQASAGDAAALLDAWGVTDRESRKYATSVALKPGGLGSMTEMLKLAHFAPAGDVVGLADLRDARAQLTSTLEA